MNSDAIAHAFRSSSDSGSSSKLLAEVYGVSSADTVLISSCSESRNAPLLSFSALAACATCQASLHKCLKTRLSELDGDASGGV